MSPLNVAAGEYYVNTFGCDFSLKTTEGWEDVTGLGSLDLAGVSSFIKK